MYYKEFKEACDAEGWNAEHILIQLELVEAKKYSMKMAEATQRLKSLDGLLSKEVVEGMEKWKRAQDEKRMEHMLNALDMAKVSNGLGDTWNKHLEKQWRKTGEPLPHI